MQVRVGNHVGPPLSSVEVLKAWKEVLSMGEILLEIGRLASSSLRSHQQYLKKLAKGIQERWSVRHNHANSFFGITFILFSACFLPLLPSFAFSVFLSPSESPKSLFLPAKGERVDAERDWGAGLSLSKTFQSLISLCSTLSLLSTLFKHPGAKWHLLSCLSQYLLSFGTVCLIIILEHRGEVRPLGPDL